MSVAVVVVMVVVTAVSVVSVLHSSLVSAHLHSLTLPDAPLLTSLPSRHRLHASLCSPSLSFPNPSRAALRLLIVRSSWTSSSTRPASR